MQVAVGTRVVAVLGHVQRVEHEAGCSADCGACRVLVCCQLGVLLFCIGGRSLQELGDEIVGLLAHGHML